MKKIIALVLTLVLMITAIPANAALQGRYLKEGEHQLVGGDNTLKMVIYTEAYEVVDCVGVEVSVYCDITGTNDLLVWSDSWYEYNTDFTEFSETITLAGGYYYYAEITYVAEEGSVEETNTITTDRVYVY